MRAYLVGSGARIEPFDCSVGEVALGDGTLAHAQRAALRDVGAPANDGIIDDATAVSGPALLVRDDVWITRRALRTFLRATNQTCHAVRFCLPRSRLLELTLPLQDLDTDGDGRAAFEVGFVPAGVQTTPRELFALGASSWIAPAYRERIIELPVPRHILGSERPTLAWPLTSTVALRVRHWLHVLRAGHFAPQVALLDRASAAPVTTALRCLPAARLSRAATLAALPGRLVFRGTNVRVHPTARVEASILGDDVQVGAYAYVRNSILGAGCVIEQRAHVNGCALGPRTFVSLNSTLSACVSFGDTDACINGVQASVFGPRCALTSFVRAADLSPGGPVKVEDMGRLREVGELPCGVAFGPDVFAGADVVIAAGRAIPRGVRLVADPARALARVVREAPPGWYVVADGTMRPQGDR